MRLRELFFLLMGIVLLSCSNDDDSNPVVDNPLLNHPYPQEWKLFKMKGNTEDSETTGEKMEWQETYILNPDSTFTKTRVTENETLTGNGTFMITENEHGTVLLLTFENENNPVIGTCYGDNKERLTQNAAEGILVSSWENCDGPGLFYEMAGE
ncbi:hypothetical protein LS482_05325 [Sinomicrobium kalidii]|uniref:hypothetical protein n=1 Tax=Sinomicrobium kalidii TaxID=2900738 RepID=UPI001E2E70A0|nr:hypothetical protein [Sinomicrobium kalidii]UGU17292.1 hypothetical protein LS482_05325 [Sinomicrobium kalidii]